MKATKNLLVLIAILLSSTQVYSQFCLCPANYGPCNGNILADNYSSTANWIQIGGTMSISSGTLNYNNVSGGACKRFLRNVPGLAATGGNFRAECQVTVNGGNAPSHYIMAFTSNVIPNTADPISACAMPWTATNNSGVFVLLSTPNAPGANNNNPCNPANPWQFTLRFKNGTTLSPLMGTINYPCNGMSTFYIRLIVSKNNACLYVYSDPGFTTQIPGSPTFLQNMPAAVTANLNSIQQGVVTYGSPSRTLNMNLDNLRICSYNGDCNTSLRIGSDPSNQIPSETINSNFISIHPNPNTGNFKIESIDNSDAIRKVIVRDLSGKEVFKSELTSSNFSREIQLPDRRKGLFLVEIYTETDKYVKKVSVE